MLRNPITLVKFMLIFLAAILVFFGFGSFAYVTNNPETGIYHAAYAFLMFIEAGVVLFCAYFFYKKPRVYWLTVIVMAANLVGTIFDQVGVVDIAFMLYNALLLAALLFNRKTFTAPAE